MLIINSLSKRPVFKFTSFLKHLNIYNITIFLNEKTIVFKCSYKILPISLKNISTAFNLPPKLIFPYKFSSLKNLFYIGIIPQEQFFNSKEDYASFLKELETSTFDFKKYSIKYCERDVLITKMFIYKIRDIIIKFKVNIDNVYSAPALAVKIFIKRFNRDRIKLKSNSLIETYVRPSYYGGRCERYGNPYDNESIYHFDFSGMYGLCMMEKFCFGNYKINLKSNNTDKPGYY